MPSSRHVRMTRIAISPRLAIRIFVSTAAYPKGERADAAKCRRSLSRDVARREGAMMMPLDPAVWSDQNLAGARFHDVRWFACIDSTNRYLLQCASEGALEGVVAVADEETAGRGL